MRIVVVEDVPMVRERIVGALLELNNIEVVGEADSVEAALSVIAKQEPDLVLLDISLPSVSFIKNGLGVLSWIKQVYPNMHVIMLTNHAGLAYREACETEGAFAFLDKSYEFEQLPLVVDEILTLKRETQPARDVVEAINENNELLEMSGAYQMNSLQPEFIGSFWQWLNLLVDILRLITRERTRQKDMSWNQSQYKNEQRGQTWRVN